jgi:hypothetical protein
VHQKGIRMVIPYDFRFNGTYLTVRDMEKSRMAKKEIQEKTKKILESKTVQGISLALLVTILQLAGIADENLFMQLLQIIGGTYAIYGRIVAKEKIQL